MQNGNIFILIMNVVMLCVILLSVMAAMYPLLPHITKGQRVPKATLVLSYWPLGPYSQMIIILVTYEWAK